MNKIYLCIDLKTFYASVECVERGLDPFKTDLIVADISRNKGAICLAISPKMKERGIRNRCRIWEIPKYIKPIIAKPRMKKYIEYSAKVYSVYLKYVSKDDIHPYSIDEMFLDITGYIKLYNMKPYDIAKMIIDDVYKTTGITATAGIGTNLYLTKVALDILAKHTPDHIGILNEKLYKEKLWHHVPLTDFWQIGRGIESRLNKLHLKDMYDISHADPKILYKEFGKTAEYLIDHSNGIEPTTIADIKRYKPKSNSLSNSQILFKDYGKDEAKIVLTEMIDNLLLQLISQNLCTSNIGFIIGYSKDQLSPINFSCKLDESTNNFKRICNILLNEYDFRINDVIPIRRIGIWFGNVEKKKYHQLDLFTSEEDIEKDNRVEETMLLIKNKYGKNAILRGTSYLDGATQIMRNKLIGGHNAE